MKTTLISMKLLTVVVAIVVFAVGFPVRGDGAANPLTDDEAAMRANVKQMEAGWNAKQGALFAKPFAEDADYVVINGMYLKGRSLIERMHQQIFDTFYKNTTLNLSVRQVRFLRPDVALVHVSGQLTGAENEKSVSNASMTMVMIRDKQGWKIAAFQNTQVVNQLG